LLYEATAAQTRLTADVDKQFWNVLRRRATTFAKDSTDLGFCPVLQHDVDTGDSPPIKQSPRRPPLSAGNAEDEILDDMQQTGVTEPCTSEWASPVCLVKKPDGSYRFCIDYRRVNAVNRKDGYPIPNIQDALDSLRGAKWFATLVAKLVLAVRDDESCKRAIRFLYPPRIISVLPNAIRTVWSPCNFLQGNGIRPS